MWHGDGASLVLHTDPHILKDKFLLLYNANFALLIQCSSYWSVLDHVSAAALLSHGSQLLQKSTLTAAPFIQCNTLPSEPLRSELGVRVIWKSSLEQATIGGTKKWGCECDFRHRWSWWQNLKMQLLSVRLTVRGAVEERSIQLHWCRAGAEHRRRGKAAFKASGRREPRLWLQ